MDQSERDDLIQKCINEEKIEIYDYSLFKDIERIGGGGYGEIFRAVLGNYKATVALKLFKDNKDTVTIKEVVNEREQIHFGLSKRLNDATKSNPRFLGLIAYVDPQSFKGSKKRKRNENEPFSFSFDKRSDIYSVGVLIWEISSGYPPFNNDIQQNYIGAVIVNIMNDIREEVIEGTPPEYEKIYTDCWQGNPSMRPTIEEVFSELNDLKINYENQKIDASQKSCSSQISELIRSNDSESYMIISDFKEEIDNLNINQLKNELQNP
ncbi:22166_t:CDS:2, partial [Racocetra persica]